jgi:hypothetical protein
MCGYHDLSENLCPRSHIDMPLEYGNASTPPRSKRDLLKDKAIDADLCLRVNYDPIWMRYCEAASNAAVDGNVGASHDTPKVILENEELAAQRRGQPGAGRTALVTSNGLEKLFSRLPKARNPFARPVRLGRRNPSCTTCELIHCEIV